MSYVYINSGPDEWSVGFYEPVVDDGAIFVTESEHSSPEAAARRVNYLNGGAPDIHMRVRRLHGNTRAFQTPRFASEASP
jgi:hypothetical protein